MPTMNLAEYLVYSLFMIYFAGVLVMRWKIRCSFARMSQENLDKFLRSRQAFSGPPEHFWMLFRLSIWLSATLWPWYCCHHCYAFWKRHSNSP